MASNAFPDNCENDHSRSQKSRSRSRSRNFRTAEKEFKRALSVGDFEKGKVLNIESNYEIFMSVSQAFENILNQLEIDDQIEQVYEKLIEIEKLVKEKISFFEPNVTEKNKTLTSSVLSLNSEESEFDNCADDSFLKEFMIKVTCPFCSKSEADKVSLIKHLDNDCKPHKYKIFEKSNHIPFSTFQILPNDAFKCNVCPNSVLRNLTKYITHLYTAGHTSAYAKASQSKYYSELLFCSCCKVQIANNYTQINFHIKHEAHKTRSDVVPNMENYLKKGIDCVFSKSKKFKCLTCPFHQSLHDSPREILSHFEKPSHIKNIRKSSNSLLTLYCEYCCTKLHVFEVINHFKEKDHKKKVEEEKIVDNRYELCFFCGFMCYDLMTLSIHMKSKCSEINEIRENNLKLVEKNLQPDEEKQQKEKIDEKKEENYIIIKDAMEIQKLFKFFQKFGEITEIGTLNEKDVKIKFFKKETVEEILLLRNVLKIDGMNLKISTDESLCKSKEKIKEGITKIKSPDRNVDVSYNAHARQDNSKTETDDSNGITEDSEIEKLFLRVSSHLANNVEKLDSESQKKLIHDCKSTLEFHQCDVVGFSACGLSFPVESISLFCDLEKSLVKDFLEEFSSIKKTVSFDSNMFSRCYLKMCESHLWKNVNVSFDGIFPLIKCEHKETQKACTINFAPSTMMLTNMLRDCLESSEIVRSFCLIIRFWLSVQELKIKEHEYIIISILVYFLISEGIVNFPSEKYEVSKISVLQKALKATFGMIQKPRGWRTYELDVKKLFQSFSVFLSTFDFDKNAICLPIQRPVPKTLFTMTAIKLILNISDSEQLLGSPICILDPNLNKNLGENVNKEDLESLLKIVNSTIKHYKIQ